MFQSSGRAGVSKVPDQELRLLRRCLLVRLAQYHEFTSLWGMDPAQPWPWSKLVSLHATSGVALPTDLVVFVLVLGWVNPPAADHDPALVYWLAKDLWEVSTLGGDSMADVYGKGLLGLGQGFCGEDDCVLSFVGLDGCVSTARTDDWEEGGEGCKLDPDTTRSDSDSRHHLVRIEGSEVEVEAIVHGRLLAEVLLTHFEWVPASVRQLPTPSLYLGPSLSFPVDVYPCRERERFWPLVSCGGALLFSADRAALPDRVICPVTTDRTVTVRIRTIGCIRTIPVRLQCFARQPHTTTGSHCTAGEELSSALHSHPSEEMKKTGKAVSVHFYEYHTSTEPRGTLSLQQLAQGYAWPAIHSRWSSGLLLPTLAYHMGNAVDCVLPAMPMESQPPQWWSHESRNAPWMALPSRLFMSRDVMLLPISWMSDGDGLGGSTQPICHSSYSLCSCKRQGGVADNK